MEFEKYDNCDKKEKIEISGVIENGKQFDLDIKLPEDNRNVVFGIVKNQYGDPISDAVVKLLEVTKDIHGDDRKPVSHTFTDKYGQFVFGPLCPHKHYAVEIWVNRVDHIKICEICKHKGKCLKGIDLDCDNNCRADFEECFCEEKKEYKDEYKTDYKEEYKKNYKDEYKTDYKDEYKENYKLDCTENCKD